MSPISRMRQSLAEGTGLIHIAPGTIYSSSNVTRIEFETSPDIQEYLDDHIHKLFGTYY